MNFKKTLPYLIALVSFITLSLLYFSPVLEGKKIWQSDIVQFKGMSQEIQEFRATHQEEPYWTNAAFGGMPAYQVSAYFPNDYIKKLDQIIRFLPRPADYLFLYFIGFFVLMMVYKVDWRLAIFGALAFGLTTYFIIILGVGHNAKADAIGYFSFVLAGVLMVYQKRYLLGFTMTTLAAALEISAGHIQMTYYLLLMLIILTLHQFYLAFSDKKLMDFAKSSMILVIAAVLALGMNLNHLLPTREYAKESTRSKTELTHNADGTLLENTGALSTSYITEYSYGIGETMNLFIPRFKGGSNSENIGTNSETFRFLKDKVGISQAKDFVQNAPMYWGDQPIVAAPAYIGAVLIFLFVMGIFLLPNKTKIWWLVGFILTLLLSWGKNFPVLTDFFINYIPLYNKFRAVSSIQVLIEWGIPVLSVLTLHAFFFSNEIKTIDKKNALKWATYIAGGIALFFVAFGSSWFSFENSSDQRYEEMIPGFTQALMLDRKSLFFYDSLRTLVFVLGVAAMLWLFIYNKLKNMYALILIGVLMIIDGFQVAKRYVNKTDFVSAIKVEKPFVASEIDQLIMKDTSHYRVANFTVNPLNDGSTSYFHQSIGGYHAAKPRRYQELFDYQISKGNFEVLNMLNTKYLIVGDPENGKQVQLNDSTYGAAWFAHKVKWVDTADQEIQSLDSLNLELAIMDRTYKDQIPTNLWMQDSTAFIRLKSFSPNFIVYETNSHLSQLALFSEMYYPYGWKATIDGKPAEIMRANYVLRALTIPEGNHEIRFSFDPEIVKKGASWSFWSYAVFIIILVMAIGFWMYAKQKDVSKTFTKGKV